MSHGIKIYTDFHQSSAMSYSFVHSIIADLRKYIPFINQKGMRSLFKGWYWIKMLSAVIISESK